MGHAWCKERSTKAQDSKSPLDRVFVRCAHRVRTCMCVYARARAHAFRSLAHLLATDD